MVRKERPHPSSAMLGPVIAGRLLGFVRRHPTACAFLCMLAAAGLGVTALSPHDRASVRRRASTNVAVLVARGVLPDSALGQQDTGPSDVVVRALTLALAIWRGVRRPGRRGREPHA